MIIFRDIDGVKTILHNIEIDQQTELRQSISGEDLINSRFKIEGAKLDIQLGDYVEFKDSVYTILDEPQVEKSQNAFTYTIQFKSDQYILKNVQVINPGTEEVEFFLFGNAIDMISIIISNLNRVYPDGAYYADYVEQTESKNISFNNENCLACIQKLATEFDCEFTVKGKKITFRKKIGQETGLTFKYKKNLQKIARQTLQSAELLTVLYPFGSERNISNEYGTKRLRIPKLEKNKDLFGTIERSVVFEDIYPRLNGVVATSTSPTVFTDTGIDFDVNAQLLGGVKAKVIFNTGDLAGREFEISRYTHSTKQVELIPFTDVDLTLPNDVLKPRVGDKYVFVGIKMPQTYIDNAEAELEEKAQEYLDKYSLPNVIYKVDPHYPALRSANIDLNLGDIITLQDEDFGIDFQTRILSIRQKLHNEYEYAIELGNQLTVSYFTQVMSDTKDIRNNIYLNDKYYIEQFNRVYNNIKGLSMPFLVNRGKFDPANYYYNNLNRRDYVYRLDLEGNKSWYYYIGQDHARGEWIEANWKYIDSQFEILATETILAENANIGDWLIQNGQIISQYMTEGEPNVQMNGLEGFLKFISNYDVLGEGGYHNYRHQMTLGSADAGISISRLEDQYQERSIVDLNTNGLKADFAGQRAVIPGDEYEGGDGAVVAVAKRKGSTAGFIAGVIGWAKNTTTKLTNKVPAFGGVFWGLKSFGRYVGITRIEANETSFNCGEYTEYIPCYNNNNLTIFLPENPHEGRQIEVKRINALVTVKTETHYIIDHTKDRDIDIASGEAWKFTFDGINWLGSKLTA